MPACATSRLAANHREVLALIHRDQALSVLKTFEAGMLGSEALEPARQAVRRSIELGEDVKFRCTGLESQARIEAADSRIFKAEEILEELGSLGLAYGPDLEEKSAITRAKILRARGRTDEGITLLRRTSDLALSRQDLHHHRRAEVLLWEWSA